MSEFIFEDSFISSIKKHKDKLDSFYKDNADKIFFNELKYKKYYMSIFFPKKKILDLKEFREHVPLLKDIFLENEDIIVSSVHVGRMPGFPNKDVFLAHRHLVDIDLRIYHYVFNCNDKSGIIIGNQYLPYHNGLTFGFDANKSHIAFNFGETVKDSLIFLVLNPKYTLEEAYQEKINSAMNKNYPMKEMNKKYALRKINKFID